MDRWYGSLVWIPVGLVLTTGVDGCGVGNRTVSTDFDRKFVRSPPSQTKRCERWRRKQLEEERNFIHDMELFDHSPRKQHSHAHPRSIFDDFAI
eukprot:1391439-Amorphochlora_amoeboformis.AAC.2